LRVPAIAAAAVPRRNEPLHSHIRLGERTSLQGLSQIHSDEFGLLSYGCDRYRAPIPASKHTETGRPKRGHLADGAMQRFRANRELFAQEPFSITIDEPFVDELTELITRLAVGGLLHASE